MALSQNDLRIPLVIDPQTEKLEAALQKAAKSMTSIMGQADNQRMASSSASQFMISGMSKAAAPKTSGAGAALSSVMSAAGPVGMAVGAIATAAVGAAVYVINKLGESLHQLEGPMSAFGAAIGQIPIFGSAVNDVLNSLIHFAGVANPGILQRFMLVVEDIQGVIGQAFSPVLEAMIPILRGVGDALAQALTPEVFNPLIRAFKDLGGALADMAKEQGVWQVIILFITAFVDATTIITKALHYLLLGIAVVSRALGILGPEQLNENAFSTGAAARPANFQSIENYERQLQVSAFSSSGRDAQTRTADATERISSLVEEQNRILRQGQGGDQGGWRAAVDRVVRGVG